MGANEDVEYPCGELQAAIPCRAAPHNTPAKEYYAAVSRIITCSAKEEASIAAMTKSIAAQCVYTILHPDRLKAAASLRGPSTFAIEQRWVTGYKLFQVAQANDEEMAVLFGDATNCSRLIYWGLLQGVDVSSEDTHYTDFPIRKFRPPHTPQELVLDTTGETIADGFIKAYAVCQTPAFLLAKVRRTKAR